jgi:hypothetical protein
MDNLDDEDDVYGGILKNNLIFHSESYIATTYQIFEAVVRRVLMYDADLTEGYWQYLSMHILSNKHNLFKNKTGDQAFTTALIFG